MNVFIIGLLAMLGLFFFLSGFLALRRHETHCHEAFPTPWAPLSRDSMLLTFLQRREKCSEVALQGYQSKKEKPPLRSSSNEIPFLPTLFRRKDVTMMNRPFDSQKQGEMTADTKPFATNVVKFTEDGFTSEEIVSLLWLRQWYQSGGSDRFELVRHWEFLKYLVLDDKLDV